MSINACVFDLETSNLNADFGIILCAVVKGSNEKPVIIRGDDPKINPLWKTQRSNDSHTIKAIAKELAKYDIWVAHNGGRFDVPFIRTRLAKYQLPPIVQNFKLFDPCQLARNKLRMSYNSLDRLADFLGVKDKKTSVTGALWLEAALDGSKKAMDEIVKHCVIDVIILDQIVDRLKDYCTTLNAWGSAF